MQSQPRRTFVASLAAASATLLTVRTSGAQSASASIGGPIRILVGFSAGGTIDIVARALADKLREDLGVSVVVENRVGAGGQLAAAALKNAAPDGRTLMLSPDHTMIVIPLTMKSPGYDPVQDFAPVAPVSRYLGALAVAANVGAKNLTEFMAWAKSNPTQANIGIPAPGSIPHFGMLALGKQFGVPIATVPYKGSAPLVQDLGGGQIAAGTTALGDFLEHHASGRVRIIAVMDDRRTPLLPEVPTFTEQGFKLEWNYWLGLFAPAGTPTPVVDRLNAAVGKALAQPDVRERMTKLVFEPAHGSPAEMGVKVRDGMRYWKPLVEAAGWVPQ